jgi:hypothetical protein
MGLMRTVTTLCPFLEAWIAYVMASSQDTNIHKFVRIRGGVMAHFIMLHCI